MTSLVFDDVQNNFSNITSNETGTSNLKNNAISFLTTHVVPDGYNLSALKLP